MERQQQNPRKAEEWRRSLQLRTNWTDRQIKSEKEVTDFYWNMTCCSIHPTREIHKLGDCMLGVFWLKRWQWQSLAAAHPSDWTWSLSFLKPDGLWLPKTRGPDPAAPQINRHSAREFSGLLRCIERLYPPQAIFPEELRVNCHCRNNREESEPNKTWVNICFQEWALI